MRLTTDRLIFIGVGLLGLIAAFWFLVLAPKREEAAELQKNIEALEASIDEQLALVAAAEQARDDFDRNYKRLVVLGKAVPQDDDTSSLFVQLDGIASGTGVEFRSIELSDTPVAAPAPATSETTADGAEAAPAPAAPATPTEAAAANLPLGATIGPAGLPVLPYTLQLNGTFFELADFLQRLDGLVGIEAAGRPTVDGRLMTVDGFSLTADKEQGFPALSVELGLTTFVTPADQGLTAGATPAGPPVSPTAPAPTPTANTTPPPTP